MSKPVYEYGCAMLYVDFPEMEYLKSMIKDSDLHENGKENEPHVTLLYGLHHDKEVLNEVKNILSTFTFNTLISNNIGLFENEEFDVLKLEVEDRNLRSINKELKQLDHTSKFIKYNPHLTIAYLKPGSGEKYLRLFKEYGFNIFYLKPSHVVYSHPDKNKSQTVKHKIDINMPLDKKSDAESYIKDFMKSKASQFKGKSREEIKKMALAAYYDSKKKSELKESLKGYFKNLSEEINESEGKYSHINFKPPQSVANAAKKGLEYRKKNDGKGGLSKKQASKQGIGSGVQRAVDLKNRDNMSPETIKRMVSFFARHEKNKKVSPGKEPWEDKGRVAWLLWGGDPGKSWADKIKKQMDKADEKSKKEYYEKIDSIISENADMVSSILNPVEIFKRYKEAEVISHYVHLRTNSRSIHKAMESFYEDLRDLTDELMETILSKEVDFDCKHGLHIRFDKDILSFLNEFLTYVSILVRASDKESIKDTLIQTEKLIDRTIYLINMH